MSEATALILGSALSCCLLLAAHIGLWPYRSSLHRQEPGMGTPVGAYTVGVACLGIGATVTAALLEQWFLAVAFWTLAGSGGALIAICWWVRGILRRRDERRTASEALDHFAEHGPRDAWRN